MAPSARAELGRRPSTPQTSDCICATLAHFRFRKPILLGMLAAAQSFQGTTFATSPRLGARTWVDACTAWQGVSGATSTAGPKVGVLTLFSQAVSGAPESRARVKNRLESTYERRLSLQRNGKAHRPDNRPPRLRHEVSNAGLTCLAQPFQPRSRGGGSLSWLA